ncbi:hypothetical protein LU298_08700 [Komagataeibacter intermedius]|uniref:hypothetical protein n=1 Tax=Komagataeibacter intermedius TaxID=66229 RepID=UPI0013018363|nr:hypothetical protein [Komagataeibacter intermedius]MCF3636581.1 hypothetical protein [Komagataeibacter intermedius]
MGDKYGQAGRVAKSRGTDRGMAMIESRCATRILPVTAGAVTVGGGCRHARSA